MPRFCQDVKKHSQGSKRIYEFTDGSAVVIDGKNWDYYTTTTEEVNEHEHEEANTFDGITMLFDREKIFDYGIEALKSKKKGFAQMVSFFD